MVKLDMFQERLGKVGGFGWWYMERIQTDSETQFTLKEFQEGLSLSGVKLAVVPPDHQEINGQVEVTWQKMRTIAHSIMVHTRVSDKYISFSLIYTTGNIFPVLPIKHLVNQDGEPTTPHKMETGIKPSVSNLYFLFYPCVVQKSTAHVDTKALNMHHQLQKSFHGIFVVIPQHQKGYLIYILSPHKIVSLHEVVFE